jgi:hypothetical protein
MTITGCEWMPRFSRATRGPILWRGGGRLPENSSDGGELVDRLAGVQRLAAFSAPRDGAGNRSGGVLEVL